MARTGVLSIDVTSVGLIWGPVVAITVATAAGAPPVWLVSVGGLAAVVSTWIYIAHVARPRQEWLTDLEQVADELWRASGAPRDPSGPGLHRAARVTQSLRDVRGPVVSRLARSLADLSNLRAVFDAFPSPTIATDFRGVVLACNRAAEEFVDRSAGSMVGRDIDEFFTHAEVLRVHADAVRGETRTAEVRIARPQGVRVFHVLGAPVRVTPTGDAPGADQPAGTGVILTMRDVTELSQAVQLKTDFVANASHELRTPLSAIRMSAETLEDGAWEDDQMRGRLMGVVTSSVRRLEDLVTDLLDLSRLETPDAPVVMENVELAGVMDSLRADFAGVTQERSLTLTFEVDPRVQRLNTDRKLLGLILKNLVENATKFAYEGTAIRVVAQCVPPGVGRTAGARFRVIDQGVGIPLDQQPRVFERFYQVDPSRAGFAARRGTGLGLAIVKHAVKTLGGTIGVESVWKQGTTMTVEIPACVTTT